MIIMTIYIYLSKKFIFLQITLTTHIKYTSLHIYYGPVCGLVWLVFHLKICFHINWHHVDVVLRFVLCVYQTIKL